MSDKPRKKIKAEINKSLGDNPANIASKLKVETRPEIHKEEANRYSKQIDAKHQEKLQREEEKLKKPHLGNKNQMGKRWKTEAEGNMAEEEAEIEDEIKKEKAVK